jgi:DNA mismatch repair protein MutS
MASDNNAIITGPNAGGKSTFIKAVLINTLLAQTIGIVLSTNWSSTPFDYIHSQINLPDCKGQESLFEAEMYRCKFVLDFLRDNPNKRTLIVLDEIFNSTNPVEGIAGAYAIIQKIAEYPNALLLFTTHYSYLTKLKSTGKFTNYKMNIERNDDGKISYPYKLSTGVSKQYIALELLAQNGFDPDIIQNAIDIKKKFV